MVHWLYKGNNACFKRKLEKKKKLLGKKKSIRLYSMFCIIKSLKRKALLCSSFLPAAGQGELGTLRSRAGALPGGGGGSGPPSAPLPPLRPAPLPRSLRPRRALLASRGRAGPRRPAAASAPCGGSPEGQRPVPRGRRRRGEPAAGSAAEQRAPGRARRRGSAGERESPSAAPRPCRRREGRSGRRSPGGAALGGREGAARGRPAPPSGAGAEARRGPARSRPATGGGAAVRGVARGAAAPGSDSGGGGGEEEEIRVPRARRGWGGEALSSPLPHALAELSELPFSIGGTGRRTPRRRSPACPGCASAAFFLNFFFFLPVFVVFFFFFFFFFFLPVGFPAPAEGRRARRWAGTERCRCRAGGWCSSSASSS